MKGLRFYCYFNHYVGLPFFKIKSGRNQFLQRKPLPNCKEQTIQLYANSSINIKEMYARPTPNSFHEVNITLVSKSDKHMRGKKNYSPFHSQQRGKKLRTNILSNQTPVYDTTSKSGYPRYTRTVSQEKVHIRDSSHQQVTDVNRCIRSTC